MFVTEALAQTATGAAPGAGDIIGFIVPMIAIAVVFYFFMIRPQQAKVKQHQELLSKVTRGDTVITNGGLIGKVVRVVDENELLVEVGKGVEVRLMRQAIADIRGLGDPVKTDVAPSASKKNK